MLEMSQYFCSYISTLFKKSIFTQEKQKYMTPSDKQAFGCRDGFDQTETT